MSIISPDDVIISPADDEQTASCPNTALTVGMLFVANLLCIFLFQMLTGWALFRVYTRAATYAGDKLVFQRVVGPW